MKFFLKFLLQVPLLVLVIAGIESFFPNWDLVAVFGLAFVLLLAYTTGDFLDGD